MGAPEKGKEKHEGPQAPPDGQHLIASAQQAFVDHALHKTNDAQTGKAAEQKQIVDGHLKSAEIVHDLSKAHSDAPKNGATLEDGPNGHKRVKDIKYDDGKSRSFTYDKEGHLTKYKDKNGHEWERDSKDPNKWNQQDGKSSMRGQMVVGKAGEFQFVNYDKKHVSHYDANGNEKKEGQRDISSYSAQEKGELRMHGNAFANSGEPQDVNPPDLMKMSVADRDAHFHNQAMNAVDGAGQAIDGAINQGINMLPKEAQNIVRPAEQFIAGAIGQAVHTVIGLANMVSPHRPENSVVQQAENATEQAMNQVFGKVSPTDYAGRAIRETIIHGIGMATTPIGTAGDIAHGIADPLINAGKYYLGGPNVLGDIGRAGQYLSDPATAGKTLVDALPYAFGIGGLAKGVLGRGAVAASEGTVAGLLEDGSSAFKYKGGGMGDAFDTLRAQRRKQEPHVVEGEIVEGTAAEQTVKTNPHEDIVDVEPIKK